MSARSYQDGFGLTFGVSFMLTLIVVPFLFAGAGRDEMSGGVFVAFLLGGLVIAIPTFFKAVIVAAFAFFPIFYLSSAMIGKRLSFVFAAMIAAYASASLALLINIEFIPPDLSFDEKSLGFASLVGCVAAAIAGIVAIVQMLTSNANA